MTNQEIKDICNYYRIFGYTINPDGSIDVNGSVKLSNEGLIRIPIKFNKVNGYFFCEYNKLTSLQYSPEKVDGTFYSHDNPLESLDGYNGNYDMLVCDNKDGLILKEKRKEKLKLIESL